MFIKERITGNMSVRYAKIPVRAIDDPQLNSAAFRVLLSLCTYTDRDGYCYPSQGTIAKKLRVSRQAVNKQIRVLFRLGYIHVTHRWNPSSGETSCYYQVIFDPPHKETDEVFLAPDLPIASYTCDSQLRVSEQERFANAPCSLTESSINTTIETSEIQSETDLPETHGTTFKASHLATSVVAPCQSDCGSPPATSVVAPCESDYVSPSVTLVVAQTTQLTPQRTKEEEGEEYQAKKFEVTPPIRPPTSFFRPTISLGDSASQSYARNLDSPTMYDAEYPDQVNNSSLFLRPNAAQVCKTSRLPRSKVAVVELYSST